jgi:chemotaxis protein CheD
MTDCPIPERRVDFVEIGVGEVAFGAAPQVLTTAALGSCVGVALWDPFTQRGALAHVMLPKASATSSEGQATRFATGAIPMMVGRLTRMGSPSRRLVAKLAGGAAMFGGESAVTHVGERNVTTVEELLEEHGIRVKAADVGGSYARTVELHLDSGTLVVRSYAFGIKEL